MKLIKRTLLAIVLSCFRIQAMQEQTQSIESVAGLQRAMRPVARVQFDKRSLLLFDGADGANQCHLNALMIMKLARAGQFDELQSSQQLFLINNLLRSASLHLNRNDGPRVLERLLSPSRLSRKMKSSLKSRQSTIVTEMRRQLLEAKKAFFNEHLGVPLALQWKNIAFDERGGMSILPKFVGIKRLLEHLKRCKDLWMVLKCQTICAQGGERIQTLLIHPDQQRFIVPGNEGAPDPNCPMPVLVVEGKAEIQSPDFYEHSKRLQRLNPERMQLAIAAAWMKEHQDDACSKLPDDLCREFEAGMQFAREHGLSHEHPETFFIHHMFPDMLESALKRDRILSDDMSPERVFREVGFEGDKQ